MPSIYPIQAIFSVGEVSPRLHSRFDLDLYQKGAAKCSNFWPLVQGGIIKRPATRYIFPAATDISEAQPDQDARFVEFVFSGEQAYIMEVSNFAIRLYTDKGRVEVGGNPFEIPTPWSDQEVWELDFVQSADTIFFTHPDHPIQRIQRIDETNWTIEELELEDGPFLPIDTSGNQLTITGTGGRPAGKPAMSYSAEHSSTSLPVSNAFNDLANPYYQGSETGGSSGWVMSTFTGASFAIIGVMLACPAGSNANEASMVANFRVEGYDGSYETLYTGNEVGWTQGEVRSFTWESEKLYSRARLSILSTNGSSRIQIGFIKWALKDVPVNLSWATTEGINGGAGFNQDDVGRLLRYAGPDGTFRTFKIDTVIDSTTISGTQTGFWFDSNSVPAGSWQLGAFGKNPGYGATIAIFQDRLVIGGSKSSPRTVFTSKSSDYTNFGLSSPLVASDAITISVSGQRQDRIHWLREMQDTLAIGTSDDLMAMSGSSNEPLSALNVILKSQTAHGSEPYVAPIRAGRALMFAGYHGKRMHELLYTEDAGGFDTPIVSLLSEHLFRGRIKQMAWAETPDLNLHIIMRDGSWITMTYEREQSVLGIVPNIIGGDDVKVLTIGAIPEDNFDRLYLTVERTINGQTRRYVECLEESYDQHYDERLSYYADSAIDYEGIETGTLSGLDHLEGQEVVVRSWNDGLGLTYNPDQRLTVQSGQITLANDCTKAIIGLPYEARMQTLRHADQVPDGSVLGRRARVDGIIVDIQDSRAVMAVASQGGFFPEEIVERNDQDAMDEHIPLFTGTKRLPIDDTWEGFGQFELYSEDPHPCLIRSVTPQIDREP